MRALKSCAVALTVGAALGAAPAHALQPSPAAPDTAPFTCPENQPDAGARAAELSRFFRDAPAGASIFDILSTRKLLLQQHGCAKMLANMQAHEAAVLAGDVLDQAWFPVNGPTVAKLAISSTYLKAFLDPRSPGERAVDTYARISFTEPQETNVTHVRYDEVVSRTVYYCGSSRHALVRNDYFLKGARVLADPSPSATVVGVVVWPVEPTRPGTLNAEAAAAACGGLRATPT